MEQSRRDPSRYPFCILEVQIKNFLCNIKCTYCDVGRVSDRRSELTVRNETAGVLDRIREYLRKLQPACGFPLLKLIGGEVFLIPGFLDFVVDVAREYETVLVTTNGTILESDGVRRLAQLGNIILQISLDGPDMVANQYRFTNERQLGTVTAAVSAAVDQGMRVEINCVVTSLNVSTLCAFAEHLKRFGGRVTLQPFPVRWRGNEHWLSAGDAGEFQRLIDAYEVYREILPPLAYLREMQQFLRTERRRLACTFPLIYVGLVDDGSLRLCNCLPLRHCDLDDDNVMELGRIWAESRDIQGVLAGRRLSGMCNRCADQFDVLSLALEGAVSIQDLQTIPSYSGPRFIERFERAKGMLSDRVGRGDAMRRYQLPVLAPYANDEL